MEWIKELRFDEKGLLPVIVQEQGTNEVLMLAYMNEQAVQKTVETGLAHYYSRSRQSQWLKGETSGHFQHVQEMYYDCDKDTLLISVKQEGGACHTGRKTCFYTKVEKEQVQVENEKVFDEKQVYSGKVLSELYARIQQRKLQPKEGSYTNYLFDKGIDKILKKVGEENAEVIIAAKNNDSSELTYEVSDLFYHLLVLLVNQGVSLEEIYAELEKRKK